MAAWNVKEARRANRNDMSDRGPAIMADIDKFSRWQEMIQWISQRDKMDIASILIKIGPSSEFVVNITAKELHGISCFQYNWLRYSPMHCDLNVAVQWVKEGKKLPRAEIRRITIWLATVREDERAKEKKMVPSVEIQSSTSRPPASQAPSSTAGRMPIEYDRLNILVVVCCHNVHSALLFVERDLKGVYTNHYF